MLLAFVQIAEWISLRDFWPECHILHLTYIMLQLASVVYKKVNCSFLLC